MRRTAFIAAPTLIGLCLASGLLACGDSEDRSAGSDSGNDAGHVGAPDADTAPVGDDAGDGDDDMGDAGDGDDGDDGMGDAGDGDADASLDCEPGALRCTGLAAEKCAADGTWQVAEACEFVCLGGECVGACTPGASRCEAGAIFASAQTCDASGAWAQVATCADDCRAGQCVCYPGDVLEGGVCVPSYCDASHGSCAPEAECAVEASGVASVSCRCEAPLQGDGLNCGMPVEQLAEDFENINALPAADWTMFLRSAPEGTTNLSQGDSVNLHPAHAGAANSFAFFDYLNSEESGTISTWLVSPELTFGDQASFSFFTRTLTGSLYPDRLEVRLCTAQSCDVPAGDGPLGTGTFGTLLASINPELEVGGYHETWTEVRVSHAEGLPRFGKGRIALRYFVTDAGGANGSYVSIDSLKFAAGLPSASVGGSVSGLSGADAAQELVLELNGMHRLTLEDDGSFAFPATVGTGTPYAIRIHTQPANRMCAVTSGARGTGTGVPATEAHVVCAPRETL